MFRGAELGEQFAELAAPAVPGSTLAEIGRVAGSDADLHHDRTDAQFVVESLRGYVGISSSHLRGLGAMLLAGPPVPLYPVMTLIRAQAEACGSAWWIFEPLVNFEGDDASISDVQLAALPLKVLDRSQVLRLDQLRTRLKRHRQDAGSADVDGLEVELEKFETRLRALHGDSGLIWEKRKDGSLKRIAGVGEQRTPKLFELATAGVRSAYRGESHGGANINPYAMLSGYAHGSIETFFSHGQSPATSLVRLADAGSDEVRVVTGLVLRMHEALLSTVVRVAERDELAIDSWSEEWWDATRG